MEDVRQQAWPRQGMLRVLGAAALVLVTGAPWVLPTAAGKENLKPPENIDVYIIDDNYTLKWSISKESMDNVAFSAEYQTEEMKNWLKLPECQHIMETKCEFSLLDTNVYVKTKFRLRAEKENNTSSWTEIDSFVPFYKAHIGPPGVHVEAEDKAILVHISHPGQGGNMWARDNFSFKYRIAIWQKSSDVKEIINTTYYTENISKLLPETTYCLNVEATHLLLRKHSKYSAVHCINTTVANKMLTPENIELNAQGKSYVMKWDYASPNVTFRAQWLIGYEKSTPGSHSHKWKPIATCANVRTTHCVFPQNTIHKGIFFLRVQASDGNSTSFWSEQKFNSEKYIIIPPPAIAITPTRDSLRVYVTCQDYSISKCHGLIYEIIFWENTSKTERRMVKKNPEFAIVNLKPLTVYCVQARVVSAMWNKSSGFSDKLCKETKPGNFSIMWIIIGFGTVFFSAVALYAGKSLLKYLKYVFFPSLKPPPSIDEFFSEPPSKNLVLMTAEEHTERCFIIENTDTVAVEEEIHIPEEDHRKYNSQSSQDSGNYSNEEENVGSESSEGLGL